MQSKEEVMLYWLIAIIGILMIVVWNPFVILIALFAYAIISLWKHYTKGIR
jgi:hypothetical protein